MGGKREDIGLGELLRELLEEKSLSIGKLSILSGVDKSTISRIINKKQRANINHLEKISKALNVSLEKLLYSAGYELGTSKKDNIIKKEFVIGENYSEVEALIKITDIIKDSGLEKVISAELTKYEEYAKTDEGVNLIHESFEKKLKGIKGSGIFLEKIKKMYDIFCSKNISITEYMLTGSALLYFIISTDVIPDFIVPIGFLDDYIAMNIVNSGIEKLKSESIFDSSLS